jgi:hypothetical protein
MAEQKTGKDVEVKTASEVDNAKTDSKNKTQELLKIQEVRMVLYIIPVVLIALLIAYLVKIF